MLCSMPILYLFCGSMLVNSETFVVDKNKQQTTFAHILLYFFIDSDVLFFFTYCVYVYI